MIDQIKSVFGDNRGVSPVIGVILMVAITVILAAVIGTFVLNLGGDLQETPQAQISVEDASDTSPVNDDNKSVLNINHRGGDTISESDLRIQVQGSQDSGFTELWDGSSASDYEYTDSDGNNANIQLIGNNPPGDLGVGGSVTVEADNTNANDLDFDGEWQVQIIHAPSDSILVDRTVSVN